MNYESIVFYAALIEQCDEAIAYHTIEYDKNPDTVTRDLINEFTQLKVSHENNIIRLKGDIIDNDTFIEKIAEYIERIKELLKKFGSFIPPDVKKWFELLLKAAEKILHELNKIT